MRFSVLDLSDFFIVTINITSSLIVLVVIVACCSASSELTISVSSRLDDEDLHQLQQTMNETLARLTRFVRYFNYGYHPGQLSLAVRV